MASIRSAWTSTARARAAVESAARSTQCSASSRSMAASSSRITLSPASSDRRRTLHSSPASRATSSHEVQSMRASSSVPPSQRHGPSAPQSQSQGALRPEAVGAIAKDALASQANRPQPSTRTASPLDTPKASPSAPTSSSSSSSASTLPPGAFTFQAPPPTLLGYTKNNLPTQTDPTLAFFVGILMRDGKKASASRAVMDVLARLNEWTSSPPLPLFSEAISRASPLVRMQSSKSGGKVTQIPIPLNPRQSTHRGIKAIIEASKKRNDRALSTRLAKEILAVLEGSSSVLARKEEQHKVAMANRANASVRI